MKQQYEINLDEKFKGLRPSISQALIRAGELLSQSSVRRLHSTLYIDAVTMVDGEPYKKTVVSIEI